MISLIAKWRIYILGTVRVSLLHMIRNRRMTLPVVPNIKGNTYTDTWYCIKTPHLTRTWNPQWQNNCNLYFCSLHGTVYYPLNIVLSVTPPNTFSSLLSVWSNVALCSQSLYVCYDPHTIAKLPAADSHIAAGCLTYTVRTVLAMLSIYLYLHSSNYCRSYQAIPVHWHLQMFQLTLNLYCRLIYED